MDRSALRRAIVGPAQVAELIFEDGLVEEILDDTQGGDALPLLAHTLQLLWDGVSHSGARKITQKMYIEIGRVQDALALRAQQIYKEIPEPEQGILRKAFVELADVNESGSFSRRRIQLSSLPGSSQKLIEKFVEARLLVTSQNDEGIPHIEVAHEALFRVWPELSQWLEKESERMKLRRDIELASLDWEAHHRSHAYLWRVERLEDAIKLMEEESWGENDHRKQFLVAAQRLAQKEHYEIQHLSALRAIGQAQNAEFELEVVLQIILDVVITELNVDAVTIFLLDPPTQNLIWTASSGFPTKHSLIGQTIKIDKNSVVGQAATQKKLIVMEDAFQGFQIQYAVPLIVKGKLEGVLQAFHFVRSEVNPEWLEFFVSLASQAAIAIVNARLFQGLQKTNLALEGAYEDTILAWQRALALRDRETEGHTERVTELTLKLASAMGIGEEELIHIRRGAILHDIGKMGIPDGILQKPGPLTEMEWSITRRHPEISYQLLAYIPYLRPSLDIPYCHHERWDGLGYPRGLKGDSIPLAARIFSVVDVWDSLMSDRPYRKSWPSKKALDYIRQNAGTIFDPQVVDVFINIIEN